MQQVLNKEERNLALLKFLLFFVITVTLVVLAVFFSYRVPVKENEWFQSQLGMKEVEEANQSKFVNNMNEAVSLLDQLNTNNAGSKMLIERLDSVLLSMHKLEGDEKTLYGKMNRVIVVKFSELKDARKELSEYARPAGKQVNNNAR